MNGFFSSGAAPMRKRRGSSCDSDNAMENGENEEAAVHMRENNPNVVFFFLILLGHTTQSNPTIITLT